MNPRLCLRVGLAVMSASLTIVHANSAPTQQDPQPRFRSGASAVAVDVTVRENRRAITGLVANDFQVYDNGVLQQVDDVSYGKLPIDVTVALDVSHSVTGNLLERLRQGVVQLMRDLGRDDRLKLVVFNMRVTRTIDFTNDVEAVERAIRGSAAGGGTALRDAVSVSLVSASAPNRRQLIVFFTDGNDSSSTTSFDVLTAVAQRTRATLTFVMLGAIPEIITRGAASAGDLTISERERNTAARRALYAPFEALARETGGTILPVGPTANLASTFRSILNDFRSAYVLYYTARGVDRAGYHTIESESEARGRGRSGAARIFRIVNLRREPSS
jgi:VWFA-related protein